MRWVARGIGIAALIAAALAVTRLATREGTRPGLHATQGTDGSPEGRPAATAAGVPDAQAPDANAPDANAHEASAGATTKAAPTAPAPRTLLEAAAARGGPLDATSPTKAPSGGTGPADKESSPSEEAPSKSNLEDLVDATPRGTGRIFGHVLDKDGLPARDILVSVHLDGATDGVGQKLDAQGGFDAIRLAAGTYTVACVVENEALLTRRVALATGEEKQVDFSFAAGVRMYGTLRRGGRALTDTQMAFGPEQGADVTVTFARTDDLGAYDVRGIQPGLLRVCVGALCVRFQIPTGIDQLRQDIDLPVGVISGHVYDGKTRAPLAGTDVAAYHVGEPRLDSGQMASRFAGTARTDDQGRYTISGLTGGAYHVQASQRGFLPEARQAVDVPEGGGADAVDLYLIAGAELSGRVLDDRGTAIEGASLTIRDGRTRAPLLGQGEAPRSDVRGDIHLLGVPIGDVLVTAHAAGFAKETRAVTVTEAGGSVVFRLAAEARVRATVRDLAGAPVEHAVLVLRDAQGLPIDPGPTEFDDVKTAQSGADGIVSRGGLAPGSYRGEAASAKGRGYFEFEVGLGQTAEVEVTVEEGK